MPCDLAQQTGIVPDPIAEVLLEHFVKFTGIKTHVQNYCSYLIFTNIFSIIFALMRHEVVPIAAETIITDTETGLKIRVTVDKPTPGTAYGTGTLYTGQGCFVPVKVFSFQAMNDDADPESLKKLARFFFASLLDAEWFIVEIPRDSALFPQEAARIFGVVSYERAI